MQNHYQPVIIVGAARSGTKLLRDLMARHPQVDRVPYDVNYIWRAGNQDVPHDELAPDRFSEKIGREIVRQMEKFSKGSPVLVEKTVGNCVRVPFVRRVFPQAKFVHLLRDGVDVVESVYRQWQSPPDWRGLLPKLRTFPWRLGFRYALEYVSNSGLRLVTSEKRKIGTWGVRYRGIDDDLQRMELVEVCAVQWTRCVEMASEALAALPRGSVFTLRYEDLVASPRETMQGLATFIGVDPAPYQDLIYNTVATTNLGKGRSRLSARQLALIQPHLAACLEGLGYAPAARPVS